MAGGEGVSQRLADRGFVVVAALVGGVDAAKAGVDGHAGEEGGIVFLPRRAVEEGRDADIAHAGVACGLPVFRHRSWGTRAATTCASGDDPLRSEEHTSELQSHSDLVCRLLLEKKKRKKSESTR